MNLRCGRRESASRPSDRRLDFLPEGRIATFRDGAQWIAPRHGFQLGCECLGVLLSRRRKIETRVRHPAGSITHLRRNRIAHIAHRLCGLAAGLRGKKRKSILQACHISAELAQGLAKAGRHAERRRCQSWRRLSRTLRARGDEASVQAVAANSCAFSRLNHTTSPVEDEIESHPLVQDTLR